MVLINLSSFISARTGLAILGVSGMLAMSACSPATQPNITASGSPSVQAPSSIAAEPSEEATEKTPVKGLYPTPEAGSKTSVGEPIKDAENRFVTGVKKRLGDIGSDSKLLEMGYDTCGFYLHSKTSKDLFDKIDDASNGDGSTKAQYSYISGAASHTLCPEYATFGE